MSFIHMIGLFTLLLTIPGCTPERSFLLGQVIQDMEDEYRRSCIIADRHTLLGTCRTPTEGYKYVSGTELHRVPQYSVCTLKTDVDRCAWCMSGTWKLASCEEGRRRKKRSFWFLEDSVSECSLFCQKGHEGLIGYISPTFSKCSSPKTPVYANEGRKTASVKWTTPAAHDGQGKNVSVVAVSGHGKPGDVFDIGLTTFVYRATDDSGLSSFCYITFEVKVHTCSVPVVAHADRVCDSNDFIFGTTCQFTCNSGYDINGASQLKCEEGGAWSHQAPTCIPKTCPDLDTFSCTDTYNYGSLCSLTCNVTAGHTVTLPSATFCLQNGSWPSPIPSCRDTAPPKISNCPVENIVAYAVSAVAMTIVTWDDVLGTDNSGNVSVTQTAGPLSGSAFPVGKTDVKYKAVDSSGNEAECEFSVLINCEHACEHL